MPSDSTVKIFTISGHQVATLTPSGNAVSWNTLSDLGDKAASGIYLYLINVSGSNHEIRGKFVIIR